MRPLKLRLVVERVYCAIMNHGPLPGHLLPEELMKRGLGGFDALHLACAEAVGADVFVTCDNRLLAVAQRLGPALKVRVGELTAVAREVLS